LPSGKTPALWKPGIAPEIARSVPDSSAPPRFCPKLLRPRHLGVAKERSGISSRLRQRNEIAEPPCAESLMSRWRVRGTKFGSPKRFSSRALTDSHPPAGSRNWISIRKNERELDSHVAELAPALPVGFAHRELGAVHQSQRVMAVAPRVHFL